ncbi:hypothetical protein [Schlesneria sp.]|uniref:hypothetical protein n=1 Tax=Schlesneria sp. TaxID=2762018 RepID=UPI002EEE877E
MSSVASPKVRLTSLDQFRGYTMFGMLLVNFLGGYAMCPRILKHTHDYCSYADTIMPQFLFAAGFAMRLSLGKRMESGGKMPWGRAIRRIVGLGLVAILWYSYCDLDGIIKDYQSKPLGDVLFQLFKRRWFQTLMHIAVTSLWILPVVTSHWKIRVGYMFFSVILHFCLSWWFNFEWVNTDPNGIDGGPLGFLTWAVPAICGTLACDAVRAFGTGAATRIALGGVGVMLIGWIISNGTVLYNYPATPQDDAQLTSSTSAAAPTAAAPVDAAQATTAKPRNRKLALDPVIPTMDRLKSWDGTLAEPPFVPPPVAGKEFEPKGQEGTSKMYRHWNYWMMSQRSGNPSYPTFAAGFSLVIYALFLWACDGRGWNLGFFRTLGTNSLAAYILHSVAGWIVVPYFPKDSSEWRALLGFACFTLIVYLCCRLLERLGWYIRV